MPSNPRTPGGTTKLKPTLEILPDSHFIVFAGDQYEASTAKVTGRVRLNCPEATSIFKPKIRLEGKRKIAWTYLGGVTSGVVEDKGVFMHQERRLDAIDTAHKVNAGAIEWPFEFSLSPAQPESVEGLKDTFIIYHLHASVSRSGWSNKDVTAQAHLRVVRTLGPDSVETARGRVNADIWANKLSYSISIPTDAVVFGTSITADVELSPIRKGLRLGKVEMRLMETIVKRLPNYDHADLRTERTKAEELEVIRTHMDFPENTKVTYQEDSPENPTIADEMYRFQATLQLPKSLNTCRQDVDSHQINISHRFKLMVNLHNPEGHVSQLVCRLPVKLFISPNLPIDESNEVHVNGPINTDLGFGGNNASAPPQYGQHQLDQVFGDIDPARYLSRTGSETGTPAGAFAESRRGSDENLHSLNGAVELDASTNHGSVTPSVLQSRLADLQVIDTANGNAPSSNSGSPERVPQQSPIVQSGGPPRTLSSQRISVFVDSAAHSPSHSSHMSRRGSVQDTIPEVPEANFDLQDLSRVPSYNAALRAGGPVTPFDERPPSYFDVASRPSSPNSSLAVLHSARGHLRSGSTTPTGALSVRTVTGERPTSQETSRPPSSGRPGPSDEEARLRMLRATS